MVIAGREGESLVLRRRRRRRRESGEKRAMVLLEDGDSRGGLLA